MIIKMKILIKAIRLSIVIIHIVPTIFANDIGGIVSDLNKEKIEINNNIYRRLTIAEAYKLLEIPFDKSVSRDQKLEYNKNSCGNKKINLDSNVPVGDKEISQLMDRCENLWRQILLQDNFKQKWTLLKESIEYTYNGFVICRFAFYGVDDAYVAFIFEEKSGTFLGYVKSGIFKF